MSSLRNAVKRITHKERSQPTNRQHLGILEKKKDYKVRSKDYHRKEDAITILRKKAAERNPDEFYFGMNRSKINKNGRHVKLDDARTVERGGGIGAEAVKLMKTQDLSYVRMQTLKDEKKVERLQASLHYLGDNHSPSTSEYGDNHDDVTKGKTRKHTVFVDGIDKANNFDVAEHFDTLPELAGRSFNRPRKETLLKMCSGDQVEYDEDGEERIYNPTEKQLKKEQKLAKLQARKISKARASAYAEMEARKKRIGSLKNAEAHLTTEKIVSSKGRKRKIKGAENGKPAIYKFRKKRAR